MNLFENFLERKNFKQWLMEKKSTKKEDKPKAKSSLDDYIDAYGDEEGKSVYYRAMKKRSKGKTKKKVNEAVFPSLVAGAAILGIPAYAIHKYGKINKRIKQHAGQHASNNAGRAPSGAVLDNIIKQSSEEINDEEKEKFHQWFRPEDRSLPRALGKRGTVRQKVKDWVSGMVPRQKHPALNRAAMALGRGAADYVHLRLTDPAELNKRIKQKHQQRKSAWQSRP
jgi:hypothetical protein